MWGGGACVCSVESMKPRLALQKLLNSRALFGHFAAFLHGTLKMTPITLLDIIFISLVSSSK